MGKQIFNIKGMTRDLSPSKTPNDFAYEIRNLRLTAQEDSTLLSLVSEKGNKKYIVEGDNIKGVIIGYCTLNNYLVLFTFDQNRLLNGIYRLELNTSGNFLSVELYTGNLGMTKSSKIEAIGIYENQNLQKVYWIDGQHQPRFINIVADSNEINKWQTIPNPFDFVPELDMRETVKIEKLYSGIFNSGTIQYITTYYNRNGQQTAAFYQSPINYISQENRGNSPEDTVSNAFNIVIYNPNTNYDYIRIYSVFRSSDNGTPVCKKVIDLKTSETVLDTTTNMPYVSFIDGGVSGEVVSYSEILYAGGANIIPYTMEQKNNTLFFGNYKTSFISENEKEDIKNGSIVFFRFGDMVSKGKQGTFYIYENQLEGNAADITSFKGGETYYFGIILQDSHGTWTDVIPLREVKNPLYPRDITNDGESFFYPVKAYIKFAPKALAVVNKYIAVKVVRMDTVPSVLCQGALCPTVFNKKREDNMPYCQSSWYFRPIGESSGNDIIPQNTHNGVIMENTVSDPYRGEVQGARDSSIGYYVGNPRDYEDVDMFVDWNTLTLHSPDIEFGDMHGQNCKMRIIGVLPVTSGVTSFTATHGVSKASSNAGIFYTPKMHEDPSLLGYSIDLTTYSYRDENPGENTSILYDFPIYTWHRNGSLTAQAHPTGNDTLYALLEKKVMASLIESEYTIFKPGPQYNITGFKTYNDDDAPLMLDADTNNYRHNSKKLYMGSVDTVLSTNRNYTTYKMQNGTLTAVNQSIKDPVRMQYKSSKHGVFSLTTDNYGIQILPNVQTADNSTPTIVNNLSAISTKGVIKACVTGQYNDEDDELTISDTNIASLETDDVVKVNNWLYYIHSINGDNVVLRKLDYDNGAWFDRNTGGTIEELTVTQFVLEDGAYNKVTTGKAYFTYDDEDGIEYYYAQVRREEGEQWEPVPGGGNELQEYNTLTVGQCMYAGTIQSEQTQQTSVQEYDIDTDNYSYIYLAELYSDPLNYDIKNRSWYVASEPVRTGNSVINANIGDTYYQRYDCLKTYPHSLQDQNQVVHIFSFMCETRINIDGRYDGRRGMSDNTSVLGTNFNLLNKAYTQNDNFFTYHYLGDDFLENNDFPNQIIWTKTKVYGSDIDAWTQIIPTSTLDLNGALGEIKALKLWNDNLICFQDMGIARIMYNERTTMTTQQGVPVEIANSGKVDGSNYISNTIGCRNKESIQVTQEGIYFIDSNTRDIYKWSQGLESLSKSRGFNTYMHDSSLDLDNGKTFYDPQLKDLYFRFKKGNTVECLVFNEQLGNFTSFFDYDMDFMFQYKGNLVSVEHNTGNLWKQFAGDYLKYFNSDYKNYSLHIISAENPTIDKTFVGTEFRADVLNGTISSVSQDTENVTGLGYVNKLPFNSIRVWNEYQDTGDVGFVRTLRKGTNLSQKFRIWRADIARDSLDKTHKFNRIRGTWARISLIGGGENMKTVIHDVAVSYV